MTFAGSNHARLEADAAAYLTSTVARFGAAEVQVETQLRYGEPVEHIGLAAEQYAAAAVVMGTHGRTGLVRSVLGSVAGGVVHLSRVPVVLIHQADLRSVEHAVDEAVATS